MSNLVEVNYVQRGKRKSTNELGMRAMQSRAYDTREVQYLQLKDPPTSSKPHALMFVALDKLMNQEIDTVLDMVGTIEEVRDDGIIIVKRHGDGKLLKVADLVNDEPKEGEKVANYLRNIEGVDEIGLIIAIISVVSGEIIHYVYDSENELITERINR